MYNRKHKLPVPLIMVCIIAVLAFKDTGIFVKEYVSIENSQEIKFAKEESINILKETNDSYIIEKEGNSHEVGKDVLIRTTRSGQKYKLIEKTNLLDQSNKSPIKTLSPGEIVQVLKIEEEYGIFETEKDGSGYIALDHLQMIEEESVSYGISKVNKVIKEGNLIYTLIKGEKVALTDFKNSLFTVVDDEGNKFKVNEDFIEVRKIRDKVTRGNVSPRSKSVNKVVTAAHKALGSPYVYGDTGKKGYDCSGLTYSIYLNDLNIKLPRSSSAQVKAGKTVGKNDLVPGDLIFFNTSGRGISHVGVYIGDNSMIHASTSRKSIIVADINAPYYKQRYVTSKRIIH